MGVWVGHNDAANEGQIVWSSGEPMMLRPASNSEVNDFGILRDFGYGSPELALIDAPWFGRALIERRIPAATVSPFGQACAGTFGLPDLHPVGDSLPVIGQTMRIELSPAPASVFSSAFGMLGLSNTTLPGGGSLPVDLTVIGMPSCWLLMSADDAIPLRNSGGSVLWSIAIPYEMTLRGAAIFVQVLVADPAANALGVVTSNALDLRLGWD